MQNITSPKTAYINVRVDKRLKAHAETVLAKIGLSTTEVITALLHQIVLTRGVPFAIRIPQTMLARKTGSQKRSARDRTRARRVPTVRRHR